MALSGPFATALQALLSKLQEDQAELDFQEQIKRRLFGTAESQLMEAKPLALRTANQGLADRGLVQSGIGLGAHGNVNRAFLENLANLKQGHGDELSAFARQRLGNQADYNWNFADLSRQWTEAEAAKAAQGLLGNAAAPRANPVLKPRPVTPPVLKKPPKKPISQMATNAIIPGVPSSKPAGLSPQLIDEKKKLAKKPKTPVIGAKGGF